MSFTVLGIDPGAVAGLVAVKFTARDVPGSGRRLVPVIVAAKLVESSGMLKDPIGPAIAIANMAILLAGMYEATAAGVEIPMLTGARQRQRVKTYGAQRETIGVLVGRLGAHQLEVVSVAPAGAKAALVGDGLASKRQMKDALKHVAGWERCAVRTQSQLEALADATGIAIAAGRIWEQSRRPEGIGV